MGWSHRALSLLCVVAACEIRVAQRADDGDDEIVNPICGNGLVEGTEVCDDGNTADGDGCSAACNSDEGCGNGVTDEGALETCDDGNLLGGDGCSADCRSDETCGNGVIDTAKGETCDDGDLQGGDGCSANCQSNESCGNMVQDSATNPPEECDAGPQGSATCDVNCTTAFCGDLTVNGLRGEQCDAGPGGNAQCDADCSTAFCGDSTTNSLRGEQCDDGNGASNDACINCANAFCGDGFVRSGVEQCDDANATLTDACTANCKVAFCGDGYVRAGVEQCDGQPGCQNNCTWAPRTFVVSAGSLLNQPSACDNINQLPCTDGLDCYDDCAGAPSGFQWSDSSPFQPSQIQIDFTHGIDCMGLDAYPVVGQLNGVGTSFTMTGNLNGCTCFPSRLVQTITISGSGYNANGTNQFLIEGATSCLGFSPDPDLGGYARITTFP